MNTVSNIKIPQQLEFDKVFEEEKDFFSLESQELMKYAYEKGFKLGMENGKTCNCKECKCKSES